MKLTGSIWEADTQKVRFPAMAGDYQTEVLIIGGGVTGVSLAALLADKGHPAILTEAHRIAKGTTGHSTGNLYEIMDTPLTELLDKYSVEETRNAVLARREGMRIIEQLLDRYGIEANQTACSMYQFSMDGEGVGRIEAELRATRALGLPAKEVPAAQIPLPSFKAMKLEDQMQINPLRYVTGLSQKINPEIIRIFEDSPVTRVERSEDGFLVHTADGQVRAKSVVYATHTPKGVMFEQTLLGPYREYGIACRLSHSLPFSGIYWGERGKEKFSVRFYEIGQISYVLVIGKRHKTGDLSDNEPLIEDLKAFAYQYFPIQSVVYSWGGQHYRPADLFPYIGETGRGEYIATGYATDGLVYGTLAASVIADLLTGKDNAFAAMFSPGRFRPFQSFKNFVRENIDVAGKLVRRALDIGDYHDRDFSQIQSETGAVIDHGGHKLAVYRAPDKKLIVKSAICPHMGCIVQFNKAEQTWDCLCHGSRFAVTGEVLEGPSLLPLASITGHKGDVEIITPKR